MPRPIATYQQAIDYLYSRLNYERLHAGHYTADDFKPERMRTLLSLLGNPQQEIPVVHIAGTKGKGSTAAMVAEILIAVGYRVGLFTSPHITAFEERMQVDGKVPSSEQLVGLVHSVLGPVTTMDTMSTAMNPTFFEMATAMAWCHFREQKVDVAVLEVGLGGRLDATNFCRPEVTLITNISLDHTKLLGDTPEQIAREKAGIVKAGIPTVSGVADPRAAPVIEEVCRSRQSPLIRLGQELDYTVQSETAEGTNIHVLSPKLSLDDVAVPLAGEHQARNAALAVGAVDVLGERGWTVRPADIKTGLSNVKWPLRVEVLGNRPTVVVDVAHNPASMAALLKTLRGQFSPRQRVLVFATTKDKDTGELLRLVMPEFETIILTQYLSNPRALSVEELQQLAEGISGQPLHTASDPAAAWKLARTFAGPEDLICVTGSFFLAAEVREIIVEQAGGWHAAGLVEPRAGRTG